MLFISCNGTTNDKEKVVANTEDTLDIIVDSILFLDFCIGMNPNTVELVEQDLIRRHIIDHEKRYSFDLMVSGENPTSIKTEYKLNYNNNRLSEIILEFIENNPKNESFNSIKKLYIDKYGNPIQIYKKRIVSNNPLDRLDTVFITSSGGGTIVTDTLKYVFNDKYKTISLLLEKGVLYEVKRGKERPYNEFDKYIISDFNARISDYKLTEIIYSSKSFLKHKDKIQKIIGDSIKREIQLTKDEI